MLFFNRFWITGLSDIWIHGFFNGSDFFLDWILLGSFLGSDYLDIWIYWFFKDLDRIVFLSDIKLRRVFIPSKFLCFLFVRFSKLYSKSLNNTH